MIGEDMYKDHHDRRWMKGIIWARLSPGNLLWENYGVYTPMKGRI